MDSLKEEVLAAVKAAQAAKEQMNAAEHLLKKKLETVMRALLKPGMTIKRRQRGNPVWLSSVNTLRGNDRGSNTFILASEPVVMMNLSHPDLSQWACEATPISEKTGKPMNGSAHGANSSNTTTVRLVGYLHSSFDGETDHNAALLKVVALAEQAMASDQNQSQPA